MQMPLQVNKMTERLLEVATQRSLVTLVSPFSGTEPHLGLKSKWKVREKGTTFSDNSLSD